MAGLAGGVVERLEEAIRSAYEMASRLGTVVGSVSRYGEVRVQSGARVEFEVDPEVYFSERPSALHRVGDYLAVVDPKWGHIVLLRVAEIVRRDELAELGVEPPISSYTTDPDPQGLLTRTTIVGELLVELDPETGTVAPAATSIEPQAPVVDPEPGVLARLLDLPEEGVPLGSLATPGGLVKGGAVPVRLPLKAFFQHVLILGTTGSGKTTLLKNIIASIYTLLPGESRPVVVVADMNQDFLQLPLPPPPRAAPEPLEEAEVRRRAYGRAGPPRALHVVVPLTAPDVEAALASGGDPWVEWAGTYYRESLEPLAGPPPGGWVQLSRGGAVALEAEVPAGFRVRLVPYSIDTTRVDTDTLAGLMPGLTSLARELLRRARERVRRTLGGYAGPLHALHAALAAAHILLQRRRQDLNTQSLLGEALRGTLEEYAPHAVGAGLEAAAEGAPEGVTLLDVADLYLSAIESAVPHKGTVEALLRRTGALLDTGMVDVLLPSSGGVRVAPEPGWSWIVEAAADAGAPVVLDLYWPALRGLGAVEAPRLAAYRMLERLISWKHGEWARRRPTPSVIVVIDEAHQFFPQEKGAVEERESSRQVAGMIARIARLGRARGVGLVFSTHSPRDLHDIILQLANTKIVLRMDKSQLDYIDLPQEAKQSLPRLPDRVMIIQSHVYKEDYLVAKTSLPLVMHYDHTMLTHPHH